MLYISIKQKVKLKKGKYNSKEQKNILKILKNKKDYYLKMNKEILYYLQEYYKKKTPKKKNKIN